MNDIDNEAVPEMWAKTRRGAWSGRGFHYQHLFSTLILVRQWAGLAPTGYLVPEGQEDCVVELPDRDIWIQIKSRANGTFSKSEVQNVLAEVERKADRTNSQKTTRLAVGLEQPCTGVSEQGLGKLFEGENDEIVICKEPETEIVNLLSQKLGILEEIAEVLARDLYWLVADSAATNASQTFEKRRRISTTAIEHRIHRYLEASDPSAINHAFESGALAPVDFITQVSEPGFYQGIKVRPGHLAAGLVLDRPAETQATVKELKNQRHLLITGPSGAGKSALMWLVANALDSELRWYQVSDRAGANHAASIARYLRACRPNDSSPIGLAFDEVGPSNSNVWNILANELRELPGVYLLGTVRNEDIPLLSNQPDTSFFEVSLSENLAQSVWQKLTNQDQTEWQHWREPYELSNGLMLEYVHLLTQGKRLAVVIGEQVRQRQQERRHDELAIIRGTAVLCAPGGEVEAQKLFKLLELPSDRASVALQRLLNEHLVRESRPGVLGGLHSLRSEALSEASHDEIVFLRAESIWQVLSAATSETLPRIIHSVLKEVQDQDEVRALQELTEVLAKSDEIELWFAVLTGLGLGTLERRVASFIGILEKHGVQRALWSAASMFALIDRDMPESTLPEVRRAVLAFKTATQRDLRADCLASLPDGTKGPTCTDLRRANQFLSCLVPLVGGKSVPIRFVPNISIDAEYETRDAAALLSTAYAVDPELAQTLASELGGEQTLLSQYHSQSPWMTKPVVDPSGEHGRTVRADWLYVDEELQADPHETIVTICETLLALSPLSDAAASDVINPSGQPVKVGDYKPLSKNIPRQNLPVKAHVAWNVAFRQILLARATTDNLTDYTHIMAQLIRRAEKVFRTFTEKWIRGKRISDTLDADVRKIASEVNRLAYATPEPLSSSMATPADGTEIESRLGSLLVDVLNNLVPRIKQIPLSRDATVANAKTAASYADSRSVEIREQSESDIWRTMASPPGNKLTALANRLSDVACILHEIGYEARVDSDPAKATTLDSRLSGESVRAAAKLCRSSAKRRLSHRLRTLEKMLEAQGWTAKCWTRPTDKTKSAYWPAVEVAVLVEIAGFDTDIAFLTDCLAVGKEQLASDWQFLVIPVIKGCVIPTLAFRRPLQRIFLDLNFEREWQDYIDLPFLSSEKAIKSEAFDAAVAACMQMSAILRCRNLTSLCHEEEVVLSKAVESFNRNREIIGAFAEETSLEEFLLASSFLNDMGKQVVSEYEAVQTGQTVNNPLCMNLYDAIAGEENEEINRLAAMRMLLRQAECQIAAV